MFCGKCGTRLEEGDVFCPECGTRAAAPAGTGPSMMSNSSGWQAPEAPSGLSGRSRIGAGGRAGSTLIGGVVNFIPSILGVLMFIWSLLPFFFLKLNLGAFGEYASYFMDDDESVILVNGIKSNLYQLKSTAQWLLPEIGARDFSNVYTIITLAVIFTVIVMLFAIATGILKNKNLLMASGIMSTACLLVWVAYMIVIAHYKNLLLNEIQYEQGFDLSELGFDLSNMFNSLYGAGLILLMITLALHAVVSIYKSVKA